MFRLELSYPMLILDSREQWLTREQEACTNTTEIQQLTEGLGALLLSTGLLFGHWELDSKRTALEKYTVNRYTGSKVPEAQPDAHSQCITYVWKK